LTISREPTGPGTDQQLPPAARNPLMMFGSLRSTVIASLLANSCVLYGEDSHCKFALSRQIQLRHLVDEGKTGLLLPPLTHADIGI